MNRTRIYFATALTVLIAAVSAGVWVQMAAAGAEVCPCVILVEVDGLEPKDVTPQTTPVMWALAHPDAEPTEGAPAALAQTPGISERAGFMWEAARGSMSASTSSAAVSLLTGSYADQDNVPADEFKEGLQGESYKLGSTVDGVDDVEQAKTSDTLAEMIAEQSENEVAAFVGDARMAGIAAGESEANYKPGEQDSIPAFCKPPANQTEAEGDRDKLSSQEEEYSCPTVDMNVMNKAYDGLLDGEKVSFAYIHLAELGAAKRLYGDVEGVDAGQSDAGRQAVATALGSTDAALGYFVNRYATDAGQKWRETIMFVVGNHGYESTPIAQRVPDPGAANGNDPGFGLESFVERTDTNATLIPQGSLATVYMDPAGAEAMRTAILSINDHDLCQQTGGCIQEVLYTDPARGEETVEKKHPSWRIHALDRKTGAPTGVDGQLVVVMSPGWTTGQAIPITSEDPLSGYSDEGGQLQNPYNGSAGGPRNRAIAAIVNGRDGMVHQGPLASPFQDELPCPEAESELPSAADITAWNAAPGDDSDDEALQCQAETVDFAPTIAALLQISVSDKQLGGRFLREAFEVRLGLPPEDVELPPLPPEEPPPPPEPDIYIPPPPPPPTGFDYHGLYRDLTVQVVDAGGCPWSRARPGAKMDYLKIEGDFGKEAAAVSLTFYRQAAKESSAKKKKATKSVAVSSGFVVRGAAKKAKCGPAPAKSSAARPVRDPRPSLKAIAKFDPFKLQRGHVVLKLKIPDLFRPTHVGIHVREARLIKPRKLANGKTIAFEGFGDAKGEIKRIADGARLHAKKRAPKKGVRKSS